MIGAIHAIETGFEEELKDPKFKAKFLEIRTNILNLGNKQIRLEKGKKEYE